MAFSLKRLWNDSPDASVERMLARNHARLQEWAITIARGDRDIADDLVQDLCVHLCLSQPDLHRIENLDGYLYTALRHLYLSHVSRTARERLRVIAVEDYDALSVALQANDLDEVDVQNDLLRICSYVVVRKQSSKSASQFLLHFFHGYHRRDVATLSRLPIAAVYNNIKDIRTELRDYLAGVASVRRSQSIPAVEPLRTVQPVHEFVSRLNTMLSLPHAKECPSEEELLHGYQQQPKRPASLEELAHLSGCQRCLRLLERACALDDRDGPLDLELDNNRETPSRSKDAAAHTMQRVRRRLTSLREHRPKVLAIAVDGHIVAFHDVESPISSISSRIENRATFIEVFDELGNRFAYLPIHTESSIPEERTQTLRLSDDRALALHLRFDGLGTHAQVDYRDPALAAIAYPLESSHENIKRTHSSWLSRVFSLHSLLPFATTCLVLLLVVQWMQSHRLQATALSADVLLAQSRISIPQPTAVEAVHRTMVLEDVTDAEHGVPLGSVESWKDTTHGELRRLYSVTHKELASIRTTPGTAPERHAATGTSPMEQDLVASGIWESDLTGADFVSTQATEAVREDKGYILTQHGAPEAPVQSRTLRLDAAYQGTMESVRVSFRGNMRTVRLVQTALVRVPSGQYPVNDWKSFDTSTLQRLRDHSPLTNAASSSLETEALFHLHRLHLDEGQPIMVRMREDGHAILEGTLADARAVEQLQSELHDDTRIDMHVLSVQDATHHTPNGFSNTPLQTLETTRDDAPGTPILRAWLASTGIQDKALTTAMQAFSLEAQHHAELLLQHSSALQRLAQLLPPAGVPALTPLAQNEWVTMVQDHAAAALQESEALRRQLQPLVPASTSSVAPIAVSDSRAFTRTARSMQRSCQSIHAAILMLFDKDAAHLDTSPAPKIEDVLHWLPSSQAREMNHVATRLIDKTNTTAVSRTTPAR